MVPVAGALFLGVQARGVAGAAGGAPFHLEARGTPPAAGVAQMRREAGAGASGPN